MPKIRKILLLILFLVLLLSGAIIYFSEDKNLAKLIMFVQPILRPYSDILPITYETSGDIPKFVKLLKKARDKGDTNICNSLPVPKEQQFFFDDYYIGAPSQEQWKGYCLALATKDPNYCNQIETHSHPNLQQACKWVLAEILEGGDGSYKFCYEQYPTIYSSADEVRNCLIEYDLSSASDFYKDLLKCV